MTDTAIATLHNLTAEQIELIKSTVCKGATDDELKLFLYTAKRTGLDPLTKQIHAVKRYDSQAQRQTMAIQTGIDGYRVIAERTGQLAGIDDAIYDAENKPNPNKASVTVYRIVNNQRVGFTASARWTEYVQTFKTKEGKMFIGPMWRKMPYLMLGKCAEALALRKAFPNDLSGLYTDEEMSQADTKEADKPIPPKDKPPVAPDDFVQPPVTEAEVAPPVEPKKASAGTLQVIKDLMAQKNIKNDEIFHAFDLPPETHSVDLTQDQAQKIVNWLIEYKV